jgi:hypothetical protein
MKNMETPDINHLKFWIEALDKQKKLALETGIFNDAKGVPLETALEANIPPDKARYLMTRFNGYLDLKETGADKQVLKSEVDEIRDLVEKAVLGEEAA